MNLKPLLAAALLLPLTARAEIKLLGTASLPADTKDKSGLTGEIMANDGATSTGVTRNAFGSAGSGIAYTGTGNLFLQAADRGPADGDSGFACRAHLVNITLGGSVPVAVTIEKTIMLTTDTAAPFVGSSRPMPVNTRFDPEGVRVAANGKDFFISDEYGPFIYKFSADGKRSAVVQVPDRFLIASRNENASKETKTNDNGRITNKGFEGLAVTPDGKKLFALLQGPLIQDTELDPDNKRSGRHCRILEVDLATGKTREFVYALEDPRLGTNEILAINDHAFLVLERDAREGRHAQFKKIFRIDITGATDVSSVEKLPAETLPAEIKPVAKKLFLDLLDPAFNLAGPAFPDKIEGLTFGPDIAGKHTLIVTNDNDFRASIPNYYYVFTLDPADLLGYVAQKFE